MPSDDLKGTANLVRQVAAYQELKQEYGAHVAQELASKNLARNGIAVPPEGIAYWDQVNSAAIAGKLDVPRELLAAETLAAQATGTALQRLSETSQPIASSEVEPEEDMDLEEDEATNTADNEELSSLADMYGFDNDEDNEEAALDDILKIQENS